MRQLADAPYAELYQRHAPGLFAYAYQRTASREEAEDLVLEVFLAVMQDPRFPAFDAHKQEAWLWTITRRKVVDAFRRSTRREHISIDWLAEPLYEDDSQTPEHLSLKRETYAQLSHAIHALPALEQELLRLRFGHGLTSKAIAAVLDRREGAVRVLLLRTLRRLRALYHDPEQGGSDERASATPVPLHTRGEPSERGER